MGDRHGACDATWFANAAGGELVNGSNALIERVETDSRNAGAGSLFVALAGERSNGHDYARKAADSGASALLVSSTWWSGAGRAALSGLPCPVIVVPDTLAALQKAATAWRSRFPSLVRFGVTGSAGKTSVKELLATIVGVSRRTVKNPGNLNSDIGLPASIFLIRPEHEAAVFEMGINRPGEMDVLASIYEPDCALISNIGSAHVGVLGGTREAIAAQKKRIASRFNGTQSLVVWEDDDYKDALFTDLRGKAVTYGPRSDDGFEGARDLGFDGWSIRYRGVDTRLRLPGAHNLLNALCAIRAATLYGASAHDVASGLESVVPLSGRTSITRGEYTIVDDCYNANAESALAALGFCDSVDGSFRRIYVLGSMKELGDESRASHRKVGSAAAGSSADILVFYGEEARDAYEAAVESGSGKEIRHFDSYDELEESVVATVQAGDMVLVKASRSLELERLVHRLGGTGVAHAS
ncbi:MAG: UDP-N-acetylmuramoyl-tripeptide--D-alanyl-D-alanine ligase [Spirochaetia bacterium]|jgi:UDP-N-acetylmuramoyl-tripeptide--D-alanyl-D-alanine ligase|nr:UDP-N-acetylmuramoyl-tripeptide--D-alanyl-D-alanine ligase [Spirochaetia bacterium]